MSVFQRSNLVSLIATTAGIVTGTLSNSWGRGLITALVSAVIGAAIKLKYFSQFS